MGIQAILTEKQQRMCQKVRLGLGFGVNLSHLPSRNAICANINRVSMRKRRKRRLTKKRTNEFK